MAADGDCPSQFLGQPWSVWTEHLGRDSPISDEEDAERKRHADVMRLPREDMGLFGHCPERDPFYTVICELCSAFVKPQGLRSHMDLWHKVTTMESTQGLETSEKVINKCVVGPKTGAGNKTGVGNVKIKVKKPPGSSPSGLTMVRIRSGAGSCYAGLLGTADALVPPAGDKAVAAVSSEPLAGGALRTQVLPTSPVSLQPVVALTPLPTANKLATIMSILPRLATQLMSSSLNSSAGTGAPTIVTPTTVTTTTANSLTTSIPASVSLELLSGEHSSRLGTSPQKKFFKPDRMPVKDREYDPDKHCGVWNEESNKPCTRSLTCKSHSMSMRRAVAGRSKHFDKLLAEHRAAKEAAGKLGKALGIVQMTVLDAEGAPVTLASYGVSDSDAQSGDLPLIRSLQTPLVFSPEAPLNGSQHSSLSQSPHSPPVYSPSVSTFPDLSVDSFNTLDSLISLPSKAAVLTTVACFTPGSSHLPRPPEEPSLKLLPRLEEMVWVRAHPKPVTVCSFSSRKFGGVVSNNRRVELFRHGLRTALTQGCIRILHANDYYGVALHTATNHATSTLKSVLTNINTKGNLLGGGGKHLPNSSSGKSHHSLGSSASRKLNQASASLTNALASAGNLKTVLPKPSILSTKSTLNHANNSSEVPLKNGQFHVPNILSSSLKRPLESYKSNNSVNAKRCKRKNSISPAEVLGTLLSRKANHTGSVPSTTPGPLVTVTIPNGVSVPAGGSGTVVGSSQPEAADTKTVFTPRSVAVSDSLLSELPKPLSTNSANTISESTLNTSAVKVAMSTASVSVATVSSPAVVSTDSPAAAIVITASTAGGSSSVVSSVSSVSSGPPQVAFVTGPVTFQQIPVLSSQVLGELQLPTESKTAAVAPAGGASRTLLLAQDTRHPASES